MTVSRSRALATASLLLTTLITSSPRLARAGEPPALAEPPSQRDKAMAEALFRAAKDLQAEDKLAEACAKYVESHRLDPKPGTILNVAACHEQEGRTATAWADYAEAATFAARARQPERERFARTKLDELAKKLSYVTFRFPDDAGLEVQLDGHTLTTASAGTRVPIDPGPHTLEAHAPRKTAWSSQLTIEPGPAERTVVVPSLADEPNAAAAGSAPPQPSDAGDGSMHRALGWVAIGVGVAAFGAGTLFGLRTLSEKSTVDEHCAGPYCDDTGLRANEDAKDAATLSTVGFALSGAAVVTGIVLLVTAPSARSPAAARAPSPARPMTLSATATACEGGAAGVVQGVW